MSSGDSSRDDLGARDVPVGDDERMDTFGRRAFRGNVDDSLSSEDYHGNLISAATGVSTLKEKLKEASRAQQRAEDEVRSVRAENDALRRREIEMMTLGTQLNHRFQSLQLQVDSIKSTIRTQLLNPISDAEYRQLEGLAEGERDLISTIKIGVYQQLGAMRAAKDTAIKRCAEVAAEIETLTMRNRQLAQDLADANAIRESDAATFKRQLSAVEARGSQVVELTGKVADLETKLKSAFVEQEQFLQAKLTANSKTTEVARLQILLKETEGEVQRYRALAECNEQKLDILKSEFYDVKLKYTQRISELEGHLRVAEERLKSFADMEQEAEVFLTNIASAIEDGLDPHSGGHSAAGTLAEACGKLVTVPNSRKAHHAMTVTRKCLQLDNQLVLVKAELRKSEDRCQRLEKSLEMCRAALNNANSPFALAEEAVEKLSKENETLQAQNTALRGENSVLTQQVKELAADVDVLSRHRGELMRIRELLRQMGARDQQFGGAPVNDAHRSALIRGSISGDVLQKSQVQQHSHVGSTRRHGGAQAGDSSILVSEPSFAPSCRKSVEREVGGAVLSAPAVIEIC